LRAVGGLVADFSISENPTRLFSAVHFDGRLSTADPGRTIVSYDWDLGDGSMMAAPSIDYAYTAFGSYVVTLNVFDDLGNSASLSQTLLVNLSNSPHADAGPDHSVVIGDTLTLDASNSYDPDAPGGDYIASYAWDLDNDGIFDLRLTDPITHLSWIDDNLSLYLTQGLNTVTLRVTDTFGLSAQDSAILNVGTGVSSVPEPSALALLASGSLVGALRVRRRRHQVHARGRPLA
jgi:hypothetical protein